MALAFGSLQNTRLYSRASVLPIVCQQGRDAAPGVAQGSTRRRALLAAGLLAATPLTALPARADIKDLLRGNVRGELDPLDAVVQLLDARGVLYEIKALAATPLDGPERKASNSLLPGYASRLRKLANAAPTVAALAEGTDKEAQVSSMYGGAAGGTSLTDPIFRTAGQVLNYSGRGLSPQALIDPSVAAEAIAAIEGLLSRVPENSMASAQAKREAARAAKR